MWKCNNCDTLNEGDKCKVCGALCPDNNNARGANYRPEEYDTLSMTQDNDNISGQYNEDYVRDDMSRHEMLRTSSAGSKSAVAIGVLSALVVVAIAVVVALVFYINGMEDKSSDNNRASQNQLTQSTEETLPEESVTPLPEEPPVEDEPTLDDNADENEISDETQNENYMNPSRDHKDEDVELYVTTVVQPPYYSTVNADCFTEEVVSDGIIRYIPDGTDSSVCTYTVYSAGTKGDRHSRMYYFDQQTGNLLFAFVFDSTTEYRFYYKDDVLVRYKAPNGKIVDNPTAPRLINMANKYLREAYFDY